MNAVEIELAVSELLEQPFSREEFPYQFLLAFGNKETTIKRLRTGKNNRSDLGGVLQQKNIHILTTEPEGVSAGMTALRSSAATAKAKARLILATDGVTFEAEDLVSGEYAAGPYAELIDHFGLFLTLAGISAVREIKENPIDIRATSRLNRLYLELLKENPEWTQPELRHEMNHLMARLIFCFFAEDTGIFHGESLFTSTVERMSEPGSGNTHEVIGAIFRAMTLDHKDPERKRLPRWTEQFPYVNGELFSDAERVPRFSKSARSYLISIGSLEWSKINPDIFGSMIQAVVDDDQRGALGMHYTSVPNILKVLNPLFLDELREQLESAETNKLKLLNLRKRISKIRVFDPACGSGNFLVIAYKKLREIENEINLRRNEPQRKTEIPLTNFRGIEILDFPAEIARLALVIAEYQCDTEYLGAKEAQGLFLPLKKQNWITCGNALRLDWLEICPPTGLRPEEHPTDLFEPPSEIVDFENEGGETFICGNPPYKGSQTQAKEQKDDLDVVFKPYGISSKQIDYVGGWLMKAAAYAEVAKAESAFVSTNSICQGRIVPILWPVIFKCGSHIRFAHTSFKWANLAAYNAGVTVVIVGLSTDKNKRRRLYDIDRNGETTLREAANISPYLTVGENVIVEGRSRPLSQLPEMSFGNMPNDGGNLLLSSAEVEALELTLDQRNQWIRKIYGSQEFIRGETRFCLWLNENDLDKASRVPSVDNRIEAVRKHRASSTRDTTVKLSNIPHRFGEVRQTGEETVLIVPSVSSDARLFLPCGFLPAKTIVSSLAFAIFDAPLWNLALIASRLHLVWIGTVCGRLGVGYRYSNTLGWNTFPLPRLTENNRNELTRCAEEILLVRERHFPATIADLYDPEKMPEDLRRAHDRNDEVLERIYIGRRFKNDTERLEKLFELYTKMTTDPKYAGMR